MLLSEDELRSDIGAINRGLGRRKGNDILVNGRLYRDKGNGTVFPVSGPGIVQLDRGAFRALQLYNEYGMMGRAENELRLTQIGPELSGEGDLSSSARTDVIWWDLVFDRWTDPVDLSQSLSEAFDVHLGSVWVGDALDPDTDLERMTIVAQRIRCGGDFPLKLDVSVRDQAVWDRTETLEQALQIVRRLCSRLNASCLIAADTPEVGTDWVVKPTGEIYEVVIDDTLPAGEFVVLSSRLLESKAA